MRPAARVLTAAELAVGLQASFEREVAPADVLAFAEVSGDRNPLHVDAAYAAGTRFGAPIAHGAYQIGLASALAGMYLPGRNCLLGSIQARFPAPLYVPCRVVVRGEIASWDREAHSGSVKVVVEDATRRVPTAEIFLGFTLHEAGTPAAAPAVAAPAAPLAAEGKPVVMVTGGSGGLGAALVAHLAADYRVLALVGRNALPAEVAALPGVHPVAVDLAAPEWAAPLEDALGAAAVPLYAIIHAAWPGMPRGGLLAATDDTIEHQVRFGTLYTVRLARFLFGRVAATGGRYVVVGSIAGSRQPSLSVATYSLGKATLETTVRLLAPELARRRIAVNAVCPGVVAVGMNKHQNERWYAMQAARVPLGRLCEPDDVVGVVRFLLSPGAAYLSGETIELTGGQL